MVSQPAIIYLFQKSEWRQLASSPAASTVCKRGNPFRMGWKPANRDIGHVLCVCTYKPWIYELVREHLHLCSQFLGISRDT